MNGHERLPTPSVWPATVGAGVTLIAFGIATSLALTAYFGAAAWRLSDDRRLDVTGQISHGAR